MQSNEERGSKAWAAMGKKELEAAMYIGYNEKSWDADREIWGKRHEDRANHINKAKDKKWHELKDDEKDKLLHLLEDTPGTAEGPSHDMVSQLFDNHAKDTRGVLDRSGLGRVCAELGLTLYPQQLDAAVAELCSAGKSVTREAFVQWWEDQHTQEAIRKRRTLFWDDGRYFKGLTRKWQSKNGSTDVHCLDDDQRMSAQSLGWTEESWEADRVLLGWRTPSIDAETAAERLRDAEQRLETKRQEAIAAANKEKAPFHFCELEVMLAGRFLMYSDREQAPSSGLPVHSTVATFGPQHFDLRLIKMVAADPPNLVYPARLGSRSSGTVKAANATSFRRNLVLVQRGGGKGFLEKTLYIQAQGALGVVFIDTYVSTLPQRSPPPVVGCSRALIHWLLCRPSGFFVCAVPGLARWPAVPPQRQCCPHRWQGPPS